MKRSIFFWSFTGIHSPMSSLPSALVPSGTWPATLQGRSVGIEGLDGADAGFAVDQAPPDMLDAQAKGAGDAHARHHHTPHRLPFLPRRRACAQAAFCFSM